MTYNNDTPANGRPKPSLLERLAGFTDSITLENTGRAMDYALAIPRVLPKVTYHATIFCIRAAYGTVKETVKNRH